MLTHVILGTCACSGGFLAGKLTPIPADAARSGRALKIDGTQMWFCENVQLVKLDKTPKYSSVEVRRFGAKIRPTPIPKIGPKSDLERGQWPHRPPDTNGEYNYPKLLGIVISLDGFWCAIFPTGNRTLGGRKAARAACTFVVLYFHENAIFRFFRVFGWPGHEIS